ncbi:MAG TPA: hypothetical protein VKI44_23355 [Acetobacteraceae bacterium]|nr:hypothetical protein [Acetobacteraceae bacterium]
MGSGHDKIITKAGDTSNTFCLDATTSSLVLHGTNNKVCINGGTDTIKDSLNKLDALTMHVGSSGGVIDIANFPAANGVVDLMPNLGFHSGHAAKMALEVDPERSDNKQTSLFNMLTGSRQSRVLDDRWDFQSRGRVISAAAILSRV